MNKSDVEIDVPHDRNASFEISAQTISEMCDEEKRFLHKSKRHPNGITREEHKAHKSENIIQRDFTAQVPYKKVLTDVTEVKCADGKLYVSLIMDCFNGEILAFTMEDNMRAELCAQSLESACKRHGMRNMILQYMNLYLFAFRLQKT